MRKLLTWYAQYFNRRHRRSGHLFENRYKSILCDEENYLLALMRYIHLNPVRAKTVTTLNELDRYPWSGHSTVMGNARHDWMDSDYVLSQFGARNKAARDAYHRFVAEGMAMGKIPEFTGGGLIKSKGGGLKSSPPGEAARKKNQTNASLGAEILSTVFSRKSKRKQDGS